MWIEEGEFGIKEGGDWRSKRRRGGGIRVEKLEYELGRRV